MKQIIIACLVFISFAGNAGNSTTGIFEQNKPISTVVPPALPAGKLLPSLTHKAIISAPSAIHKKCRRPAVV